MKDKPEVDKNFRKLSNREQADLILEIIRENADSSGRLECPDGFRYWLQTELVERGYKINSKLTEYSYSTAFSLLKSLGLVVSLNKAHTSKPSIFRVDLETTIDEAKELKKQLNTYFASDLKLAIEKVDGHPRSRVYYEVRIAHLEFAIEDKDKAIARLSELLESMGVTLQEANKLVKEVKKRKTYA